jgi:hypothetical protein
MSATPSPTIAKNAAGAHWLGRLVRRVFCRHSLAWVRNIHGDEMTATGCRTVWICEKCGKYIYDRDYVMKSSAIKVYDSTNAEAVATASTERR